jgi:hypothetical protein
MRIKNFNQIGRNAFGICNEAGSPACPAVLTNFVGYKLTDTGACRSTGSPENIRYILKKAVMSYCRLF